MKKLLLQIFGLTVIDFILIWLWVNKVDPDPSVSIYIIVAVPFVFFLNLIIAGVLYFVKKDYAISFLINSVIASILMYFLFLQGIDRHVTLRYDEWTFQRSDTLFTISQHKESDTFSFSYSTEPGFSTMFLFGSIEKDEQQILLLTDSTKYKIRNNYLLGFRSDSIKLTKFD